MGANAKITTARLVAGEESPVTIEWTDGSDGRGPRTHTLELRSIEQRKQRLKGLDLAKNAVPLIASVRIAPGHETATLPIPPDAAPAYEGTIMAWRYELRVVDADAEIVEQTEASIAPGHIAAKNEPARSKALNYSKLAKNPGVDVKTSSSREVGSWATSASTLPTMWCAEATMLSST